MNNAEQSIKGQRMARKVIADFNKTAAEKVKLTKILFPEKPKEVAGVKK